jgi:N-acetylmuramoyl-L-alanine amidase
MGFVKPRRAVSRVFVHCTASERDTTVGEIRRWHKQRGWSDIGYHYVIRRDGRIQDGRPIEKIPAAQRGHNTGSIAIVLNGLHRFTIEQTQALAAFCMQIDDAYGHAITFHGHNEVANKACPVFDYRKVLRLDAEGHMQRANP